jgi:uncharacterized membrane protein YsdA (DUF1294 family)
VLLLLLLLPALATLRLARSLDPRLLGGYFIFICGTTFWLYWNDKRRAEANGWRIPESTLHFTELMGGWPAAFLAQRVFRHKVVKVSFQVTFWAIVLIHQVASFDFLQDWYFLRSMFLFIQG